MTNVEQRDHKNMQNEGQQKWERKMMRKWRNLMDENTAGWQKTLLAKSVARLSAWWGAMVAGAAFARVAVAASLSRTSGISGRAWGSGIASRSGWAGLGISLQKRGKI